MKPTSTEIDNVIPASGSASKPPTAAKGTLSRISVAIRPESNVVNSRKKIASRVTGRSSGG